MRENEMTFSGKQIPLVGLGVFVGILVYELVKAWYMGMALSSSLASSAMAALGRTVCILFVYTIVYVITKKNK